MKINVLRKVNEELRKELASTKHTKDINEKGAINNALMTSVIIAIGGLLDKDKKTASLYQIFDQKTVDNWRKNNQHFKKIIEARNKFEAHNEINYLEEGKFGLSTSFIIDPVLEGYLQDILSKLPPSKPKTQF